MFIYNNWGEFTKETIDRLVLQTDPPQILLSASKTRTNGLNTHFGDSSTPGVCSLIQIGFKRLLSANVPSNGCCSDRLIGDLAFSLGLLLQLSAIFYLA